MRINNIDSPEDRRWLIEVHFKHLVGHFAFPDFVVAEIHGNDDCPQKVLLFTKDHYRCIPFVYVPNEDGVLMRDVAASKNAGKLRPKTKREKEAGCL